MHLSRALSLAATVALAAILVSPPARADDASSEARRDGAAEAGEAGVSDPPDPPDGTSVGGGGGCSVGRAPALELGPLGFVAAGTALLAAIRARSGRRRS